MSNTREFDDESFEAFLDALPDVEPPEHLKHSVFAAIDAGEHTSPIAQPIAEVVELPRRRTRGFFAAAAAAVMLVVGGNWRRPAASAGRRADSSRGCGTDARHHGC